MKHCTRGEKPLVDEAANLGHGHKPAERAPGHAKIAVTCKVVFDHLQEQEEAARPLNAPCKTPQYQGVWGAVKKCADEGSRPY